MNHNDDDAEQAERAAQAESIEAGLPGGTPFPETEAATSPTEAGELGRSASTAVGGLVPDDASDAK